MKNASYEELMRVARLTNKRRDRDEREVGFATPSDGGPGEIIKTAMFAIEAGIRSKDWSCVAEAQALLEELRIWPPKTKGGDQQG